MQSNTYVCKEVLRSFTPYSSKLVRAQIDSASTCNTMLSNVLSQLFLNLKVSKTRSRMSTYGSQTMWPKGQVTLVCDRKGRLPTIDFFVVGVPGDKPPLLSRKDARLWSIWRFMQTKQRSWGRDSANTANTSPTQNANEKGHFTAVCQCV